MLRLCDHGMNIPWRAGLIEGQRPDWNAIQFDPRNIRRAAG